MPKMRQLGFKPEISSFLFKLALFILPTISPGLWHFRKKYSIPNRFSFHFLNIIQIVAHFTFTN